MRETKTSFTMVVERQKGRKRPPGVGGWIIIKMDLRTIRWEVMDWIDLAQDRDQ